ncbi:MAG: thioredoxin domain-containing protein [Planctomycetia bacterium]|nr:thioredoxin domain-containing protein [Planctomycetia bacterium]
MTTNRALTLAVLAAALATAMHFLHPRTLVIESAAEEPKKDEFPFSPRPNRAREIHWRAWAKESFEEARKAGKPVVVSLTATWCQKCHEMDEGAFSDERVIALLNEKFVCIRVDTDRYPEVKDRYLSSRGWPTTAFCSPDGEVISKTWFVGAEEFLGLATKAAEAWARDGKGATYRPPTPGAPVAADPAEVESILAAIERTWAADGSAWAAPGDTRFPSYAIVELYVRKGWDTGEKRWVERAAAGVDATLKIEDAVEFGFYRVAMKPDWSDPHFEKLLETNAGMLSALVQVWRATGEEKYGKAASRTVEYLGATLAQGEGGWSASQDADPDYFALDRAGREKRAKPHVDTTFYSGANAQAASAMFAYAAASGDGAARAAAAKALERVFAECWGADGLAHGGGAGRDLLRDLALAGDACLDAHQATGEWAWVKRAEDVAGRIAKLADADGALFDRPPDPEGIGHLKMPLKKSADNARAAGFLARLQHVTGVEKWKALAEGALKATGGEAARYPAFSAEYATAVLKLRKYPLHVVVVGPKDGLAKMVAAADRFWHPWKTVTVLESGGAEVKFADLEYPPELAAYACVAEACGPPVHDPAEFEEMTKAFLERNK